MFIKTLMEQREKILQKDKQIKELQEETNHLQQENKDNRYIIEELEDYKRHLSILHKNIEKQLLDLQNINKLGYSEDSKNIMRNKIINEIIKELADTNPTNSKDVSFKTSYLYFTK